MRAWVIDGYNGIESLRMTDLPDPAPGPGEVVLCLDYAALNPADYYLAQGQYPAKPTFPHVLGRDGVGTVIGVGPGVAGVSVGDVRGVMRGDAGVNRNGTFAERVALPAVNLVPVPTGWTRQQTAAAPLVYVTAHQALTMWGEPRAGAVVLVTGASGGVGVACVQLARAMGHTVVALSRDPAKRDRLRTLGAAHTYDPTDADWRHALRADLGERRVDLAVDNVGGEPFNHLLDTLGMHGRVSCVGRLAGPVPGFNTASLFFRRLRIGGVAIGTNTPAESQSAWADVLRLLRVAGAMPLIDGEHGFDRLPEAFARLRAGPMGKVVLRIGG